MTESSDALVENRKFKVGDCVTVIVAYSEVTGWDGKIVAISDDPDNSMPYLVSLFRNLREWPFEESELVNVYEETNETPN